MTKRKDPKDYKKSGQPTKFTPNKIHIIKTLVQRGFTDLEIANVLEINQDTFYEWKKKHPKFSEALKDWKDEADAKVERSLYESASGYETKYKKNFVVSDGKDQGSHIESATEELVFPPNPTSCIFWLKNRKHDNWKDKREIEHSGEIGVAGRVREARVRVEEFLSSKN